MWGVVIRMQFGAFVKTVKMHPVVFAEALFAMTPATSALIARGYRPREVTGGSITVSASVQNQTLENEKEVDIDELPVAPEKEKKQRGRRTRDVGCGCGCDV